MTVAELGFTGERFLPACQGEIWLEHWHRYHFAASLAPGRRVLDVASGEGYGSALLALTAREVVGVDAAADAIAHAGDKYKDKPNLRFVGANCAALPFPDAAFDLVVSFETIEHITAQREFLFEVRRVLAPDGLFLLSSPNKAEYSDRRGYANPFHVAELYRDELRALLHAFFPHTAWYGQRLGFCSTITAEATTSAATGELVDNGSSVISSPTPVQGAGKVPLYYLVGCAQSPSPLTALDKAFSVLGDPADTIYRDYQDTYRKFVAASEAVTILREREAERAASNAGLGRGQREAADLRALTATLGATLHAAQQSAMRLTGALHDANSRYQAALDAAHAANEELVQAAAEAQTRHRQERLRGDAMVAALRRTIAVQEMELMRRTGWRWRLRPPWRRNS